MRGSLNRQGKLEGGGERSRAGADGEEGHVVAKVIAATGLCSRRDAVRLIQEGRVKVNSQVLVAAGTRVGGGDEVEVDGKVLQV